MNRRPPTVPPPAPASAAPKERARQSERRQPDQPQARPPLSLGPGVTALICGVLLLAFAAVSYNAVLTKSATWDEPEHLLGSYIHRFYRDYRINPEDPALFGRIVSLPLSRGDLRVDLNEENFPRLLEETGYQWPFIWVTLYRSGNDPDPLLNRARAMCTLIGVLLGVTIAWWSFRLGGACAAIIATALFAFCPNFLGHSSLVKNDVMLSAAILALMFSLWRFGRRGTVLNLASAALFAGAAVSVKYSGVMVAPFVALTLLVRALLPETWNVIGLSLDSRLKRLALAAGVSVLIGVVSYTMIWACYGFRFSPTPDPHLRLNMQKVVDQAKANEMLASRIRAEMARTGLQTQQIQVAHPTQDEIDAQRPSVVVRFALWLNQHHLLPHAWLYGFVYTYKSTLIRNAYLLGELRLTGWWYFFPLAMLFKTPLATTAAAAVALMAAMWRAGMIHIGRRHLEPRILVDRWGLACLLIAPSIYGLSAMTTNLNLGLRHVLPLYPFIFIGIALVLALIVKQWKPVGLALAALLLVGLAAETVAAYPHYIAFFNTAAGGSRGGFHLLGDSNLDWGQDLKLLAEWQRRNPDTRLYLSYFGSAEPEYYGIDAIRVPGYADLVPTRNPDQPGILAIHASNLQGIYLGPAYAPLLEYEPIEVLGGTIYLYELPPRTRRAPAPSQN